MDVRHESFIQELINQLTTLSNDHLKEHTDSLVTDPLSLQEIEKLCTPLYDYIGIEVDIPNILSRHNLLSIDVVLLPLLNETEIPQLMDPYKFSILIDQIKLVLKLQLSPKNNELRKKILGILDEHGLQS